MAWWRRGGSDPAPPRHDAATVTPAATRAPVQRSAWRDLPTLQPTLTTTAPIAPLDRFTSSLATNRNPSFLAPLGHVIDPVGPSGQIAGLASPVVPHAESSHTELAVAAKPSPAGQAVSAVQRLLATPRMWFSDNDSSSDESVPDAPPAAPSSEKPAQSAPVFMPESPRQLPTAMPTVSRAASYISAPVPAERRVLPAVSLPTPVTVSRHASADHDHSHDEPEEPDAVQTAQLLSASVPLVPAPRETPSSRQPTVLDAPEPLAGATGLPGVQRSAAADSAPVSHDSPLTVSRSASLPAAPTTSTTAAPAPAAQQPQTAPTLTATDGTSTAPMAMRDEPSVPASVQRATSTPSAAGRETTAATELPLVSSPATGRRSVGLGAPLPSGSDPLGVVQRHAATPGPSAPPAAPASTSAPTLGSSIGGPLPQLDPGTEIVPSTMTSEVGGATASTFGSPVAEPDLALPTMVQRAAVGAGENDRQADDPAPVFMDSTEPDDQQVAPPQDMDVAPLVGGSEEHWAAPTSPTTNAAPTDVAGALSGLTGVPGGPGPVASSVQRSAVGATAPSISATPTTAPTVGSSSDLAIQRVGFGAPLAGPTASEVVGDRVTVREMSLQRMFEPAAAAIASGAAYSDGPGSVVFHPPTPPSIATAAEPVTSALPVARSAPRVGSTLGLGAPVQRFGIPGASSLLDKAKSAAGGVADSARSTASSYADSARSAAGSYADTARQAVGGYADSARQAAGGYADQAGGYVDQARGTLGSYADAARGYGDTAAQTAGGYLDSARSAASGYADRAGGYADQARGLAGGAADTLGGYAGAAQQAAGGYLASARQVVGGVAESAGDAVQGATSAATGAVGNAVESASGTASGLAAQAGEAASGAGSAISGAVGAVTGAAAGAAGAAAGALPTDLDELARRLFDPLSARIRNELMLDRERAGMITDLRR